MNEKTINNQDIKEDESVDINLNNINDKENIKYRKITFKRNSNSLTSLEISQHKKNKFPNQRVFFDKLQ